MTFRFIHASDIHLGYEQYNLAKRADDFAHAYFGMVAHAIEVRADFVLIGGDLFHHAHPDALTVRQALNGLESLHQAHIPVIAIEGNHDTTYAQKNLSWLAFLCGEGHLSLLNVAKHPNGYRALVPYDPENGLGSYLDLDGVRIYGLKYHGAATARLLEEVGPQIERGPGGYTILMLHTGMEGQIPHLHGGLTGGQIEPLRDRVDYLALGHIHKRLTHQNWVYNPGSTETNSMEEMDWEHGFFDVQVDLGVEPKHTVSEVPTANLRAFRRISIGAEGVPSLEEFVARAEETIADTTMTMPGDPVIELHLGGVAEFRRQDVPIERLKAAIETRFSPLTVRVRNALIPPGIVGVKSGDRMPRAELERQVVERLVHQIAERREEAPAWARLILDVKNMAIEGDLPASIADHLRAFLPTGLVAVEEEAELPVFGAYPLPMSGLSVGATPVDNAVVTLVEGAVGEALSGIPPSQQYPEAAAGRGDLYGRPRPLPARQSTPRSVDEMDMPVRGEVDSRVPRRVSFPTASPFGQTLPDDIFEDW